MFRQVSIKNWRQFAAVEIDFHDQLTILTGANGAGKTTILQLLNRHWGWNLQLVSAPRFTRKGQKKYWAGFWGEEELEEDDQQESPQQPPSHRQIGAIAYSNDQRAELWVPETVEATFAVDIRRMPRVDGVYVPSHRPPYVFQPVNEIPTQLDAKQQIFQAYLNELMARFTFNQRTQSPSFRIKSALISLATFGYGNEAVDRNDDAVKTFEGFQDILKTVLPKSLGFNRIHVRVPDIMLETSSGDFTFDAVSGGVAALIDVTWQIYMSSLLYEEFVVVIDEPEAHLHPALQQRLLPDLLSAFPQSQFIVATHNPFIVTSVPDSRVYVLDYNDEQRVASSELDLMNRAGSANEILRDVLGVPFTLPIWVDERMNDLVTRFAEETISEASLSDLRREMNELGLDHLFPDALARVLESVK